MISNRNPTETQQTTTNEEGTKKVKNDKESSSCRKIFSDEQKNLAELLLHQILQNLPSFKQPKIDDWANEIRLMMERDCRTAAEIEKVIMWCQQDSFWKANILSVATLRKQYDRLIAKMNQPVNKTKKTGFAQFLEEGDLVEKT